MAIENFLKNNQREIEQSVKGFTSGEGPIVAFGYQLKTFPSRGLVQIPLVYNGKDTDDFKFVKHLTETLQYWQTKPQLKDDALRFKVHIIGTPDSSTDSDALIVAAVGLTKKYCDGDTVEMMHAADNLGISLIREGLKHDNRTPIWAWSGYNFCQQFSPGRIEVGNPEFIRILRIQRSLLEEQAERSG